MSQDIKLQAIQSFIDAGYILFPCNGKIPTSPGWRNTKYKQYSPTELAVNNYGVALTAEDIVIDIDPRNFTSGDKPLHRLIAVLGDAGKSVMQTFRQKSGGGGLHILFKKPAGIAVVGKMKDYQGIDIKSAGGYIIGAGSIHPDTKLPYSFIPGSLPKGGGLPFQTLEIPSSLLDLIKRPTIDLTKGTGSYQDDEVTKERFVQFLIKRAEPAIEGQGGDATTFKTAARGRDFGLSPAVCYELLVQHYNPRCEPPWDENELKDKVNHAYRYAAGAVGSAHPAANFNVIPVAAVSTATSEKQVEGEVESSDGPKALHSGTGIDGQINWTLGKQGQVTKNFNNLLNFLKSSTHGLHKIFGYNEFTAQVEFISSAPWHLGGKLPRYRSVQDADLKHIKAYLASRYGFERTISEVEEAITVVSRLQRFHPVRDYLLSLKWDGVKRIDFWLRDYLGVKDTEYTRAVARKTLCAGVMRVFFPGCEFHHVLVLEGGQDIGKSTVCKILASEKFYGDFTVDPHNKDTVQNLQGLWIVELAELATVRKTDTDALKAFLSRHTDRIRVAFGRLPQEFPRQSLFIGSYNPDNDGTYLKDTTGNRRWWPVRCAPPKGQVLFAKFKEIRDQLWAEAVSRVQGADGLPSECIYMETPELKAEAAREVAIRVAEHEWVEHIGSWLDNAQPQYNFITARDIFINAMGGIDKQFDKRASNSVAQAMKLLGWVPSSRMNENNRMIRGFIPKAFVHENGELKVNPPVANAALPSKNGKTAQTLQDSKAEIEDLLSELGA